MHIPEPRGPISAALLAMLAGQPTASPSALAELQALVTAQLAEAEEVIENDDVQLALFCLYELHYGGLDGVDDGWEWNPGLITIRQLLEQPFERKLLAAAKTAVPEVPPLPAAGPVSDGVATVLFALAAAETGPSLSKYVAKKASLAQLREFLIHKSIYQLKEAARPRPR